jgi:hypothetical protein
MTKRKPRRSTKKSGVRKLTPRRIKAAKSRDLSRENVFPTDEEFLRL